MIHAQRYALVRVLFSVDKKLNIADIVMAKFVGVRFNCVYEIGILNHGEEETFRDVAQDGVVDGYGF